MQIRSIRLRFGNTLQWIANGKIIAKNDVDPQNGETTYVLDLDEIEGAEDFLYIRCELFGDGGCTLTQALEIDDGTPPKEFTCDTSTCAQFDSFINKIRSLRIFALIRLIKDEIEN